MEKTPLLGHFLFFLNIVKAVFKDVRTKMHVCEMGVASIVAARPKTITSLVEFNARHGNARLNHRNWSASYKMLSRGKWKLEELSWALLDSALEFIGAGEPVMLAVDDTLLRKTGRRNKDCAYARDPLSPPFQTNLVWGQRVLCVSVLIRASGTSAYRAVPVFFLSTPSVKIPAKASPGEKAAFVEEQKKYKMSVVARGLVEAVRRHLDESGLAGKELVVCADASFANRSFLYDLPDGVSVVCRCRNDLRLRRPLKKEEKTGKRLYGERLPTPDAIYKDGSVPEHELECGVMHQHAKIIYKAMEDVRWQTALLNQSCSIYAVKGQYYRKYGKKQHTRPAFLVMTGDVAVTGVDGVLLGKVDPEVLLEAYLLRWEIEVGFRDQKNWLGVGKAQVWNAVSVKRTPAFMSACYAMLLMASMRAFGDKRTEVFDPLPGWRNVAPLRPSIRDLVTQMRKEIEELGRVPA